MTKGINSLPSEVLSYIIQLTLPFEISRNNLDRYTQLRKTSLVNSSFRSHSQSQLFQHVRFRSALMEKTFYQLIGSNTRLALLVRSIYWAQINDDFISLKTLLFVLSSLSELYVFWPRDILQLSEVNVATNLRNLHLISTSGINFEGLNFLSFTFNRLEHLSIINPHPQDLFLLLNSAKSFPQLTSLVVIFSSGFSFRGIIYNPPCDSICTQITHLTIGIHGAGGAGDGTHISELEPNRLTLLGDITRSCKKLESLSIISMGGNPKIIDNIQLSIPFPQSLVEFAFICSSQGAGSSRGMQQLESILKSRLEQIKRMEKIYFHYNWLEMVQAVVGNCSKVRLIPSRVDVDGYLDYYSRLKRGYSE